MPKKEAFEAIATLVGTVIGAGILGIPYVVAKAGLLTGLLVIVFIGLTVLLMNLYIGEVVLRTKGKHQLTGYAEKYLGKWGKRLMSLAMIFGIYGALTAYIIGVGASLYDLSKVFSPLVFSILFFIVVGFVIYIGLRWIEEWELFLGTLMLFIIVIICVVAFSSQTFGLVFEKIKFANFFIPYGVVLFAFLGDVAVPEMSEELGKNKKAMKKAIIIGSLIPLVIYFVLAVSVVGAVGVENFLSLGDNERIATIALGMTMGKYMMIFGDLFAVFAMTTSFLALALALKEMYTYDFKLNKNLAWALTCFIPLGLFLFGIKSFIGTIGIAGAIAGGTSYILVVLMFLRAKKLGDRKPEYTMERHKWLCYLLILVMAVGVIHQLLSFFGIV